MQISIHALREEGDRTRAAIRCAVAYFYPRPPRGGRLERVKGEEPVFGISIHALREEGDMPPALSTLPGWNFYPRPPRGGRRQSLRLFSPTLPFLSTPSARRATDGAGSCTITSGISIHALREEGDDRAIKARLFVLYFYPRPPRGGRRWAFTFASTASVFLSTPSARRATMLT